MPEPIVVVLARAELLAVDQPRSSRLAGAVVADDRPMVVEDGLRREDGGVRCARRGRLS